MKLMEEDYDNNNPDPSMRHNITIVIGGTLKGLMTLTLILFRIFISNRSFEFGSRVFILGVGHSLTSRATPTNSLNYHVGATAKKALMKLCGNHNAFFFI